ncbi:urease accessory protein (plasmid) [Frondihabitans sp. PAMC 28766]|uniref:urease accessory protein UreF n=1 Tax=Frondihabitans sp. PAMC 28766 TaxID=1795630 RepID=UPI00078D0764|nr:urease accessory UreF family protein [Frondihabitans sp. PAMC 28766]AMM22723.1 urease accessory protein [Frondihabitans sp. PAMC 28766]
MLSSTTVALLLADARLPSGGHAHSAGMEPAIVGGLRREDIPAFLLGRARTTTLVEAGTAVVARHRFLVNGTTPGLQQVVAAWAARTPSPALRDAARLLGRGYLRLASRTWPDDAAVRLCAELGRPPRAIVLGAIAAATLMEPQDLVRLMIYDEAQSAASAVLKLDPLDPAVPVTWVLDTCAALDDRVDDLSRLTTPEAIPASGAPQAEGWAEAHALLTQRLFRA